MGRLSKKKQKENDIRDFLCCNPFRKRRCGRANIAVEIMYKGEKLPICGLCWVKISKGDQEWGAEAL